MVFMSIAWSAAPWLMGGRENGCESACAGLDGDCSAVGRREGVTSQWIASLGCGHAT